MMLMMMISYVFLYLPCIFSMVYEESGSLGDGVDDSRTISSEVSPFLEEELEIHEYGFMATPTQSDMEEMDRKEAKKRSNNNSMQQDNDDDMGPKTKLRLETAKRDMDKLMHENCRLQTVLWIKEQNTKRDLQKFRDESGQMPMMAMPPLNVGGSRGSSNVNNNMGFVSSLHSMSTSSSMFLQPQQNWQQQRQPQQQQKQQKQQQERRGCRNKSMKDSRDMPPPSPLQQQGPSTSSQKVEKQQPQQSQPMLLTSPQSTSSAIWPITGGPNSTVLSTSPLPLRVLSQGPFVSKNFEFLRGLYMNTNCCKHRGRTVRETPDIFSPEFPYNTGGNSFWVRHLPQKEYLLHPNSIFEICRYLGMVPGGSASQLAYNDKIILMLQRVFIKYIAPKLWKIGLQQTVEMRASYHTILMGRLSDNEEDHNHDNYFSIDCDNWASLSPEHDIGAELFYVIFKLQIAWLQEEIREYILIELNHSQEKSRPPKNQGDSRKYDPIRNHWGGVIKDYNIGQPKGGNWHGIVCPCYVWRIKLSNGNRCKHGYGNDGCCSCG